MCVSSELACRYVCRECALTQGFGAEGTGTQSEPSTREHTCVAFNTDIVIATSPGVRVGIALGSGPRGRVHFAIMCDDTLAHVPQQQVP